MPANSRWDLIRRLRVNVWPPVSTFLVLDLYNALGVSE